MNTGVLQSYRPVGPHDIDRYFLPIRSAGKGVYMSACSHTYQFMSALNLHKGKTPTSRVSLQLTMILYSVIGFLSVYTSAVLFNGFDCQSPENPRYISHHQCNNINTAAHKKDFAIVQKQNVKSLTGYSCNGFRTYEVSYCGAYSHTKHTGETRFNVPMSFSKQECMQMISSRAYNTQSQSFSLNMNTLSSFSFYTHGSIKYSGTNIECTGTQMRLSDGNINDNLIRQEHLLIEIRSHELMIMHGKVIEPTNQIDLGFTRDEFSQDGPRSFIWAIPPTVCPYMVIMKTTMQSNDFMIWYDDVNKIQLSALDTFHDVQCDMKVTKTTANNIFLISTDQTVEHLNHIDSINVDLSMDLQIRFSYLYAELNTMMFTDYNNRNPLCNTIQGTMIDDTINIGNGMFLRNLGDISVTFTCSKVIVAPVISSDCYSMAKVSDIQGRIWFLSPVNRMLISQAIVVPCTSATLPVYRSNSNELVVFSPNKSIVTEEKVQNHQNRSSSSNTGLYPVRLIKEFLDLSFIQHVSKYSYSFISNVVCQHSRCADIHTNTNKMKDLIGETIASINTGSFIGLDIVWLGSRCSIAVIGLLILYTGYALASWFIRMALFKDGQLKLWALLCRATFPSFFLITTTTNKMEAGKKVDVKLTEP